MKIKHRVSWSFGRETDPQLIEFAGGILTDLFGDARFVNPPVTAIELGAAIKLFSDLKIAQATGGALDTVKKNAARAALLDMVEKLAAYVQMICDNDLAILLASGFKAVSSNKAQTQLEKPTGVRLANGLNGQTLITVDRQSNARSYEVEQALTEEDGKHGPFVSGGMHTKSRGMQVNNLTPGRLYVFRLRAIGGLTVRLERPNQPSGELNRNKQAARREDAPAARV